MANTLFTGSNTDSISWDVARQSEALASLKSLRIRPTRVSNGYCQVTYEAYTKLRQGGLMTHQMSGE